MRCVIARGLIAVALLSALAACGNSTDQSDSPTSPTSPSTSQSGSPTSSATPSDTGVEPLPSTTATKAVPQKPAFPTAKDGQNYKACNDGNCEVLIRKKATLTVDGLKVVATAARNGVTLTGRYSDGSSFEAGFTGRGSTSWGSASNRSAHTATLKTAVGTTAILILTSK